ncbi:NAD-dependent epimerase/dehydratase family protein [Mycobacterium sp. CVI_P3]|uniref:NAD-dependent epimerase/dehydratase family protein n=1 Tax=Mycobacterium pinniadriaticum TaxID=2994102 RepID=A0ABT3SC26_9MYCO|nr:NAD-dependent epimerase/dehydratase family protein [Mycobacterium pinniadriaticum]MCX2930643.1 NAD-dependent epimerase/dehydratase family protein [Mycobacterium pinniadriaticum]MCX2937067.1 NAD-dependent epimerase/dehydratase family protein [Mycobacterium pinniadriaticum]
MTTHGRVLLTGGTGAFGAATAKWLTRAGHDVVVFARHEPRHVPRGARFVRGDIADLDSVRQGMAGCDTVVHLAWVLSGSISHAEAEPVNLGGTRNVLRAMGETGCKRLVFASSVTAYGAHPDHQQAWLEHEPLEPAYGLVYEWHKAKAEAMIIESGVEAIRVRPTVAVGRDAHNAPANLYRQLAIPNLGGRARIQMVHQYDVGRFFAHACDSAATGAVNLAADDVLTWTEVAHLARRPALPTPPRILLPAVRALSRIAPAARSAPELVDLFLHWPLADTTRLKEDFGFTVGYSSADAIADQGRNATSHFVLGMREIRRPFKLDRTTPCDAAQSDAEGRSIDVVTGEARGEFDTPRADPGYPEWTCANLAEAFPGPMTPLSLELVREALFSGADQVARLLPLDDRIKDNVRRRQIGVFGHRFYQNLSVLSEMASAIPGQTAEDFEHQINGKPYPPGYERPRQSPRDVVKYAGFAVTAGPRLVGVPNAVAAVERRADEAADSHRILVALTDESLRARIETLWGDCVDGWKVGLLCTFLVSAPTSILQRRYGPMAPGRVDGSDPGLASSRLLQGVTELAVVARGRPVAASVLAGVPDADSWADLRGRDPQFAQQIQRLVEEVGHRGPGETELANAVYADAPWLLLRAINGAIERRDNVAISPPRGFVERGLRGLSHSTMAQRERCRDAVMKLTHQLRLGGR